MLARFRFYFVVVVDFACVVECKSFVCKTPQALYGHLSCRRRRRNLVLAGRLKSREMPVMEVPRKKRLHDYDDDEEGARDAMPRGTMKHN